MLPEVSFLFAEEFVATRVVKITTSFYDDNGNAVTPDMLLLSNNETNNSCDQTVQINIKSQNCWVIIDFYAKLTPKCRTMILRRWSRVAVFSSLYKYISNHEKYIFSSLHAHCSVNLHSISKVTLLFFFEIWIIV